METTRRQLLVTAAGVAAVGASAGCVGGATNGDGSESGRATAQSPFFVFGDVAANVAADAAATELLVPVGQHGHGWEPGPRVREAVHDAALFVHGPVGFQPWVDDILGDLDDDGSDVATVDVASGVELLPADDSHDHSDQHEHGTDHHDEHTTDHHDEHTTDHHDEHTTDHHDEDQHEHDRGTDPHFWMDPLRLGAAIENVRDALSRVDPDNAETYAENAASFRADVDDLHGRLESTVAEASKGVVLVAGHNALRYFGERYGVEIEALTNVSPDDRPTPRDIERAQTVVDRHDLRYVCADPLESQRAAEQLVAETDAEAVLPLTSMPGLTDEWEAEEWGYLDVMRNVNLPTLERALEA
ncbi:metal ABC transporter substrate-binding protein [Halobellus litoreus]|uniref:Metal ABC transporter substrate-binding protein n=1 Tax=Halobellus litoreus TaxID=755310 RepID=A0ABD6DUD1_9EURY|nr:metal ABC transporter substrate-binding protein [Halobellus litoreus]